MQNSRSIIISMLLFLLCAVDNCNDNFCYCYCSFCSCVLFLLWLYFCVYFFLNICQLEPLLLSSCVSTKMWPEISVETVDTLKSGLLTRVSMFQSVHLLFQEMLHSTVKSRSLDLLYCMFSTFQTLH